MGLDNSKEISVIKIAVDAMGGDFAPEMVVKGAVLAAKNFNISSILVGYEDKIRAELEKNKDKNLPIEVCHAPEVIEMGEEPYHMIRKKKYSSLRIACELVRQNEAQALMSAGNSGAVVYGALFVLKRIKNISRPGIATLMPSLKGRVMVIDAGANTLCRPQNLAQFALMGSVYFKHVFGILNPKVGVLSNGEEETKGTDLTREANELLKKSTLNYIGYAEGKDVFAGDVDIVVCDGFVGNVVEELDKAGKKDEAFLALLAWNLEGLYITGKSVNNRFSPESAKLLRNVSLYKYLEDELKSLSVGLRAKKEFKAIMAALPKINQIINRPESYTYTQTDAKELVSICEPLRKTLLSD